MFLKKLGSHNSLHLQDISGAYIVTITGHSFTVCIYADSGRLAGARTKILTAWNHMFLGFLDKTKTSRRCISVSFKPLIHLRKYIYERCVTVEQDILNASVFLSNFYSI